MSIPEAIKGARAELARIPAPIDRARRILVYARILTAELLGTVLAVPYGLRAYTLHRSLPAAGAGAQRAASSVSILRDVRYGRRDRNVMDVYLPPDTVLQRLPPLGNDAAPAGGGGEQSTTGSSGAPVVLFCHGGVWASGSKWHYAPMATRLAQAGVITAVMQYTLYPEVLLPTMVAEVSQALTWTLDHIDGVGGDAKKVSLVGHSAGAHMCAMALLHRALRASQAGQPPPGAGSGNGAAGYSSAATAAAAGAAAAAASGEEEGAFLDQRMPALFVGLAGVYDIAKHFEYERGRDVHELSTMKRVCGGEGGFASQSPAVILARALEREGALQPGHQSWAGLQTKPGELLEEAGAAPAQQAQQAQKAASQPGAAPPPGPSTSGYYGSFALRGEAIARRIGLERVAASAAAPTAAPTAAGAGQQQQQQQPGQWQQQEQGESYLPPRPPGLGSTDEEEATQQAQQGDNDIMCLSVRDARRLPPCALFSSCSDTVVPWYESSEMYWMLHDCGVPAKHLVYNKVGHADFVTGWRPRAVLGSEVVGEEGDLPDCAADLVKVVAGRVALQWSSSAGG